MIRTKGYPHSNYVTLNSPLLKNFDEHGLIFGSVKNLGDLLIHNVNSISNRQSLVKWGFFVPSPVGISTIQKLVENKQVD